MLGVVRRPRDNAKSSLKLVSRRMTFQYSFWALLLNKTFSSTVRTSSTSLFGCNFLSKESPHLWVDTIRPLLDSNTIGVGRFKVVAVMYKQSECLLSRVLKWLVDGQIYVERCTVKLLRPFVPPNVVFVANNTLTWICSILDHESDKVLNWKDIEILILHHDDHV